MIRSAVGDCEALMNALIPFAKQMLEKHGEFYPAGGAMFRDGSIATIPVTTPKLTPAAMEVMRLINARFREGADSGEFTATALVYGMVMAAAKGSSSQADAIAVQVDHQSGYSALIVFPYTRSAAKEVILSEPTAVKTYSKVFGSARV